jgi:hypothetical protein
MLCCAPWSHGPRTRAMPCGVVTAWPERTGQVRIDRRRLARLAQPGQALLPPLPPSCYACRAILGDRHTVRTFRTRISITIALLLGAPACSQEQIDWKQAESQNTIGIYQAFIRAHPQSEHVQIAKQRIDDLRFERVKARDTPFDYRKFIAKYPNSAHAEKARNRLAELEIGAAMKAGTAQALAAILRLHPRGKHVAQARARLAQLYPPFEKESALVVTGLAASVDPGQAMVSTDQLGKTCTIKSGGAMSVSDGKTCGLLCRERLELGPEARVPVAWAEPQATTCTELRSSDDFAVKLERPCKSGADEVSADAALGYIVAGAKGAVLEKKSRSSSSLRGQSPSPRRARSRPGPPPANSAARRRRANRTPSGSAPKAAGSSLRSTRRGRAYLRSITATRGRRRPLQPP